MDVKHVHRYGSSQNPLNARLATVGVGTLCFRVNLRQVFAFFCLAVIFVGRTMVVVRPVCNPTLPVAPPGNAKADLGNFLRASVVNLLTMFSGG